VLETSFVSNNTIASINSLKTLALYFDRINVALYGQWFLYVEKKEVNAIFRSKFEGIDFQGHLSPLVESGLIRFNHAQIKEPTFEKHFVPQIGKEVRTWPLTVYPEFRKIATDLLPHFYGANFSIKPPIKTDTLSAVNGSFNSEVEEVIAELGLHDNSLVQIMSCYLAMLRLSVEFMGKREAFLTDSGTLDSLIRTYLQNYRPSSLPTQFEAYHDSPRLVAEIFKLAIPNVSSLSSSDILELRFKLKDELAAFRSYIEILNSDLFLQFDSMTIQSKAKEIVNAKVRPALDDLIRKMQGVRLIIPKIILDELRDPKSYSPLLLNLTTDVSPQVTLLASLGLISSKIALEVRKESGAIRKDGLYYLLQLRRKLKR
jgi:hypothetical protein